MTLFVIAPQPRILQLQISNPEEIVCLWKRKKRKRWQQAAHTFLCVIRFPRRPFQIKNRDCYNIYTSQDSERDATNIAKGTLRKKNILRANSSLHDSKTRNCTIIPKAIQRRCPRLCFVPEE